MKDDLFKRHRGKQYVFRGDGFILAPGIVGPSVTNWRGDSNLDKQNDVMRRSRVIRGLARYLVHEGFTVVGGPVLSGALFANELQVASGGKLHAMFMHKDGYEPAKHSSLLRRPQGKWALVDDLICTGKAVVNGVKQMLNEGVAVPPTLVLSFYRSGRGGPLDGLEELWAPEVMKEHTIFYRFVTAIT